MSQVWARDRVKKRHLQARLKINFKEAKCYKIMSMEFSRKPAPRPNIAATTVEGGMHENLPQGALVSNSHQKGAR
jgi:hypothetical protein